MRLLIDIQGCQNGSRTRGIGRYALALTKAMAQGAGTHEVWLLANGLFGDTIAPLRDAFSTWVDPARFLVFDAPGPVDELRSENAWRQRAAELLREQMIAELAPDAVLVTSMVEGSSDNTVTSVGRLDRVPVTAAVLYDLIPLLDPQRYIAWPPLARWYMSKMQALRRCDVLLAISDAARLEGEAALGLAEAQVINISTAADEAFVTQPVDPRKLAAVRKQRGLTRPYLMHSGNVEARKNFVGLVRAFGQLDPPLRDRHQLVLVGRCSPEARAELDAAAASVGLASGSVIVTGHVDDEELAALYAGCHLFVFPSFHEGFGLPALEAMHFGVPTIGSKLTSVPEVIGRDDALFDPGSVAEMASAITRALRDGGFRDSLARHAREHAKRFTWARSAGRAWQAIESALRDQQQPDRWTRRAREQVLFSELLTPAGDAALRPGDDELSEAANLLERNRSRVELALAHASPQTRMRWRLEGPFDSSYSLALVNREAARALESLGHEVVLKSTEGPGDFDPDPAFLARQPDLARMHARSLEPDATACDVISRNLYPPRVNEMTPGLRVLHHYAWEETGLPSAWVEAFNRHLQGIGCLSTHVAKVLRDNGVEVPLVVVGCGVDHWERIEAAASVPLPGRRFRFLHVSSCFPRKGVDVMLKAFGDTFTDDDDVSLVIKTFPNPHHRIHELIARTRAAYPRWPDVQVIEDDLPDEALKALYRHCQVLVAPSRAEGFGLPIAEALLTGLPVITTAWGGAMDFCDERSAWLVDFSFAPADTHFGLRGSVWAEPSRTSLGEAMRRAHVSSPAARAQRAALARGLLLRHFNWRQAAAHAVSATRRWRGAAGETPKRPRLAWITTWNTRCGIAAHARQLLQAEGSGEVAVLAPHETSLLQPDEAFVHRCWRVGKTDNAFESLAHALSSRPCDGLVIQFNYGFFAFEPFADFVQAQLDVGRAVIVVLHATGDPPELAAGGDPNWRLATLKPVLARCQRLLVHTLADLNRLKDLGLVDNVALFPQPLPAQGARERAAGPPGPVPHIATFGYCLPHKGLPQLVEAVALLQKAGMPLRLTLLTAEYPAAASADLVRSLRERIADTGLGGAIDLCTDHLPAEVLMQRLAAADLLVFPYQGTQESSSSAVRMGMASGSPVLVTQVPIFDELGDAVFRSATGTAAALADAMRGVVQALRDDSPQARAVAEAARAWREPLAIGPLARRLQALCRGVVLDHLQSGHLLPLSWWGSSPSLAGDTAQADGRWVRNGGKAGVMVRGPGLPLAPGRYRLSLAWRAVSPAGSPSGRAAILRVAVSSEPTSPSAWIERPLPLTPQGAPGPVSVQVNLRAATAFLIEIHVDDGVDAGLSNVQIERDEPEPHTKP